MNGRVAESLVVEPPDLCGVEVLEVFCVCLAAEEIQIPDFEITEELTVVVFTSIAFSINQPIKIRIGMNVLRMSSHELLRDLPETRKGSCIIQDIHVEAVDDFVVTEEAEWVVGDRAEEVDVWFDAPVVGVGREGGVKVEEAGVPAAHIAVGEEETFAYTEGAEVGEGVVVAGVVDVGGWGPMVFWDEVVRGLCGGGIRCCCLRAHMLVK